MKLIDLNCFQNPLNGYFENKRSGNFGADPKIFQYRIKGGVHESCRQ